MARPNLSDTRVQLTGPIATFTGTFAFLSNFYMRPVVYEGLVYPSAEHAYQAAKSADPLVRLAISKLATAAQAKRAGRSVLLRPDWEEVKVAVMRAVLDAKFSDPELAERLLNTGEAELIEGNWWGDVFWGVCRGRGKNKLGQLLMQLRAELRVRSAERKV